MTGQVKNKTGSSIAESVASGGGLLSRRKFIANSAVGGSLFLPMSLSAAPFENKPVSWQSAGNGFTNYGVPPDSKAHPIRWITHHPAVSGEGVAWTPHHQLQGSITPNGLHFERHHNGVPTIDAGTWELALHGMVARPVALTLDDLHRLPMHSEVFFIECGGNSNVMWRERPVQTAAGYMHGLMSCAEWTGVRLSAVLDIAGIDRQASWIIADGLDSSGVTVSIPLAKALDDVIIGLYQNGEPVRPSQGFPARLVVPGWEGITHVKWLRSIMLADKPLLSKFDSVSYTDLLPDGTFKRFSFEMGVKSFISQPSPGFELKEKGVYEIRGLAWSGAGSIKSVEVSADGGESWATAELQQPVLQKSVARFRMAWNWSGAPALLVSRATDSEGNVQPYRSALIDRVGTNSHYHYNGTTTWFVGESGSVRHVYT